MYGKDNPIVFIDPDGAFDEYFGLNGEWLGVDENGVNGKVKFVSKQSDIDRDVVAGAGNYEWGNHPFSGTVSWDRLITKNFGTGNNLHFFTTEEAKAIWNQGFIGKTVKVVTDKGRMFILK